MTGSGLLHGPGAGAGWIRRGNRALRPLDSRILVDPEEAERHKTARRRHINVVTYPIVRLIGFQLMVMVLFGHNLLMLADVPWQQMMTYVVVVELYCLLSWWALVLWFDRIGFFDLGLLFLMTDLVLWTAAVYVSGGHTSWLFFLLTLRVADQSFVSFRRAAAFAHLVPLCYLGMLIYQHQVDAVAVDWGRAGALTLLLYLSSLYLLLSGMNAERLRERSTAAVRLARQTMSELQDRSTQLARAKEDAEAASIAKSQFLANMSHELKTPLNAVIGYSEMLLEDPETDLETRQADLEKIRASGQHLLALINEVLELARLETGKSNVTLASIDVPSLAQEVALGLSDMARKNGNTLEVRCDPAVATMVSDPAKVRRILTNLLGNALKFTENGQVRLEVQPADQGRALRFIVSDTGIGISEEQLARLFQPFTQADGSSTRKHGGAALGLTLTRRYCEMLGGTLGVQSTLKVGSVFTALLPVTLPEHGGPAA